MDYFSFYDITRISPHNFSISSCLNFLFRWKHQVAVHFILPWLLLHFGNMLQHQIQLSTCQKKLLGKIIKEVNTQLMMFSKLYYLSLIYIICISFLFTKLLSKLGMVKKHIAHQSHTLCQLPSTMYSGCLKLN